MERDSDSNCCRDPFDDALHALLDGEATPRDLIILNDALRSDPEARRSYREAMAFEAMLAREFPALEEAPATAPRRRPWLVPAAIAATVALAATLAWRTKPWQTTPLLDEPVAEAETEFTHAVVTSLDDASGRFGQTPLAQGQRLSGGMLELDRGVAEITFDTGAEVTLEGPARLQLESEHKARLAVGRAAARVPEQARGFVIHTPTSYIRDLGTTYAVEVRDDRQTDLHVLEGEVEVAATGRPRKSTTKILRQKEAVRFAAGDILPISFRADNPAARPAKRAAKIPASVHWSFDDWTGNTTTDSTRGHVLKFQTKSGPAKPDTIDGPFGLALHFDGQGTFARSNYPGVGGSQARTVACWLRLDPATPDTPTATNGIVAWGVNRSSSKWQIGWNKFQAQGTTGATRVEFGDGHVIGSTDLRDGRWHHLAVVFLGGPKANLATHVRIYVDGILEPLTGRKQRKIDTDTSSTEARPLTLGRALGATPGLETPGFEGDLDEVHVFEGALLPGQIVRLMKQNLLRQPAL